MPKAKEAAFAFPDIYCLQYSRLLYPYWQSGALQKRGEHPFPFSFINRAAAISICEPGPWES